MGPVLDALFPEEAAQRLVTSQKAAPHAAIAVRLAAKPEFGWFHVGVPPRGTILVLFAPVGRREA